MNLSSNIPRIALFGSGGKNLNEGGSGIQKILERIKNGDIQAKVGAIITNYENGGVAHHAQSYGIAPTIIKNFPKRETNGQFSEKNLQIIREIYQNILKQNQIDFTFLSGWLKYVLGLTPNKTINIHPGPTHPPYGGPGMFGDNIHKKIWEDYQAKKIQKTCITMHYVTPNIDEGPTIAQIPIPLEGCQSWEEIKQKVNQAEHQYQWKITKHIIDGDISWTGNINDPVIFPAGYKWREK